MKRLISVLTLGLFLVLGLSLTLGAAETELVDVYPYEQEACLLAEDGCTQTKVGKSDWTLEYNGYRYHFVRGSDKYVSEMTPNGEGYMDKTSYTPVTFNAFGMLFHNNTDAPVKFRDGDRTALTVVMHRMWSYFDEEGVLQMFENHIYKKHMVNDKHDSGGEEWRFADAAEAAAYDAAADGEKPANMLNTHFRIIRDKNSTKGYVLEPLGYLKWTHANYDSSDPTSKKSILLDYDPNEAHLPAGWKIVTSGTYDRSTYEVAMGMVEKMPDTFLEETPQKAVFKFPEVAPKINGWAAKDQNEFVEGVQLVNDWNVPFAFDVTGVSATWLQMFDENGKILHKTQKLPFNFIIKDIETKEVLETITYTANEAGVYEPSGPFTKVDTSEFENMYAVELVVKALNNLEDKVEGEIVVGVLPNRFEGVPVDRYEDDGIYVDISEGITAFNGNNVEISDALVFTHPANFNPYNPLPGEYEIEVYVDYEYVWPAVFDGKDRLTFKSDDPAVADVYAYLQKERRNVAFDKGKTSLLTYIDYEHKELVAETKGMAWGSVAGVIGADGYMKHTWDGFTSYTETKPDGTKIVHADGAAMTNAIKAYVLQEGEAMILAHGSAEGNCIRYGYGKKVTVEEGRLEKRYTAKATTTYNLIIDDRTPPQARAVQNPFKVDNTMYETVNEAILANVVGFDNYGELSMFVTNDGGADLSVPGKYTVKVEVEDEAGNSVFVQYTLEVVEPKLTQDEVDALLAAQKASMEAERQTQITNVQNQLTTRVDEVEAQPDKVGAPIWLVILLVLVGSGASFAASFLLLRKK